MTDNYLIAGRFERSAETTGRGTRGLGRSGGFTLLELVIVIIIVTLLIAIAIGRLLVLQADAERVAMETVVGTLRSSLGMRVAKAIVRQDFGKLEGLEGSNPMDQLAELPTNYLGAFDHPNPAGFEDGNWYFDKTAGELIYLVRNKAYFSGGSSNPPRARFAVRLLYLDRNRNGRFDDRVDSIEGLRLAPVESYTWVR